MCKIKQDNCSYIISSQASKLLPPLWSVKARMPYGCVTSLQSFFDRGYLKWKHAFALKLNRENISIGMSINSVHGTSFGFKLFFTIKINIFKDFVSTKKLI